MSDQSETLAAILAEMRDRSDTVIEGRVITERNLVSQEVVEDWADRIEAAAERECNAHVNDIHNVLYMATGMPGNAAAMREALVAFVDSIQWLCDGDERGIFKKQFAPLLSEARAALSAPARNCDRPECRTEEGASATYIAEHPHAVEPDASTYGSWLLATAKGGDHA